MGAIVPPFFEGLIMPEIIVENGTMPEGANSYVDVAGCDAWHLQRNSATWPLAPNEGEDENKAAKEAALIKACDYLNGLKWKGQRAAAGRVLAWPRKGVVDGDGYAVAADVVPDAVMQAQCYLAGLAYGEDGVDLQPVLDRGGQIQSETVGPISTSYFEGADVRDAYTFVTDLLSGLALGLSGQQGDNGGMKVSKVVLA